jgi:hypothetical protein
MTFSGWISVLGKAAFVDSSLQKLVMTQMNAGFPEHQKFDNKAWVLLCKWAYETLSLGHCIVPSVCHFVGGFGRADWLNHFSTI